MRQLRFVPLTALTVALTGCTLADDAPAPTTGQPPWHQVPLDERVPVQTEILPFVAKTDACGSQIEHMLSVRDRLQMFRIHTSWPTAPVVQFDSFRERAVDRDPHRSVSFLHLAGDSHRSVSLICTVTGIQPAPRFLVDLDAREDFRHRLTIGSNVLHAAKMWHTGVLRQRRIA